MQEMESVEQGGNYLFDASRSRFQRLTTSFVVTTFAEHIVFQAIDVQIERVVFSCCLDTSFAIVLVGGKRTAFFGFATFFHHRSARFPARFNMLEIEEMLHEKKS